LVGTTKAESDINTAICRASHEFMVLRVQNPGLLLYCNVSGIVVEKSVAVPVAVTTTE
jgi:hypothetical protein